MQAGVDFKHVMQDYLLKALNEWQNAHILPKFSTQSIFLQNGYSENFREN